MRNSCFNCARKHLAQALVVSHELPYYEGDDKDDHTWVLIGHLAEAADQIQKQAPAIAETIRNQRIRVMENTQNIYSIDLNSIIREISEIADADQRVGTS